MAQERLDKLLSSTGRWSRREVKELIRQGRVWVDGVPARRPEEKCEPGAAGLTVDGERVDCAPFVYLMLHKPAGLLSATEDRRQKTVLDLLPPELQKQGLFPVGRLDKDTEGLLLLTNEGGLAHDLLSPKKHVDKEYYLRVEGCLTAEDCAACAEGLRLDDGLQCQPAELVLLTAGAESEAHITIREGKFHQIKRMMAYLGKSVLYLERVRMGNLTLDPLLSRGAYRFLTPEEQAGLGNLARENGNNRNLPKK